MREPIISIYQHFRKDEWPFVDQIIEWHEDVKLRYRVRLTDFLDPRQQQIVTTIIGNDDEVNLSFSGGSPFAERKRAFIAPTYTEVTESDYNLVLFSIHYPAKFITIEHRDVLGSLMNLGLKREKFGDIVLASDDAQLIVASEIADYVEANVQTIGKANVSLKQIELSEHKVSKETWEETTATVSSLRLDVILSQLFNLSRTKVLPYISRGLVKVNFKVIEQNSFSLEEGDQLSVRGFGRAKIIAIEGRTKREKLRVRFGRLQ